MHSRFDIGPLARGVGAGLRKRRQLGTEPRDRIAVAVLTIAPLAAGALVLTFKWSLSSADSLVAGFSLFAAALLAVFPQLASWRERLTARQRATEGVSRRAIDEAVAHVLSASVLSMVGAGLSVALANLTVPLKPNEDPPWLWVAGSAALTAVGTYLLLVSIVIVNLLWDAYVQANKATAEAITRNQQAS